MVGGVVCALQCRSSCRVDCMLRKLDTVENLPQVCRYNHFHACVLPGLDIYRHEESTGFHIYRCLTYILQRPDVTQASFKQSKYSLELW